MEARFIVNGGERRGIEGVSVHVSCCCCWEMITIAGRKTRENVCLKVQKDGLVGLSSRLLTANECVRRRYECWHWIHNARTDAVNVAAMRVLCRL